MIEKGPPGVNIFTALEVTNQTTRNARPLNELDADLNTINEARRSGVLFENAKCPFSDSRKGGLMNVSAFKEIHSNWQPLLDGLAWINFQYFSGRQPKRVSPQTAVHLALIGRALPTYFFNKKDGFSETDGLPDLVGDIYKTCKGIYAASASFANLFIRVGSITGEDVYDFASGGVILHNKENPELVCPAPPKFIIEATSTLLYRTGGNPENSKLGEYIPDFSKLKKYSQYYLEAKKVSDEFTEHLEEIGYFLKKEGTQDHKSTLEWYLVAEKEFLQDINRIQKKINRVLERDPKNAVVQTPDTLAQFLEISPREVFARVMGVPVAQLEELVDIDNL